MGGDDIDLDDDPGERKKLGLEVEEEEEEMGEDEKKLKKKLEEQVGTWGTGNWTVAAWMDNQTWVKRLGGRSGWGLGRLRQADCCMALWSHGTRATACDGVPAVRALVHVAGYVKPIVCKSPFLELMLSSVSD